MKRSPGYRVKAEHREEAEELRKRLGQCRSSDWARAKIILQQIAELAGYSSGPAGGAIIPRCCRTCGFYGHSSDRCPARRAREDAQMDSEIKKHKREREGRGEVKDDYLMKRFRYAQGCGRTCYTSPPCYVCKGCRAWLQKASEFDRENGRGEWAAGLVADGARRTVGVRADELLVGAALVVDDDIVHDHGEV